MPTKVQSRLTTQAGLPTTLHFSSATAAGNCLVLQIATWTPNGPGVISAASDAVNGAWTEVGGGANLGSAVVQVFVKLGAASIGSSNNLTLTFGSGKSGDTTTRLSEWSGVATASALDPATYSSTTGDGTSATAGIPTGSITTTSAADLYLSWAAEDGGTAITWSAATSPWSLADNTGDITYIAAAAHDRTDGPAAGTYSDTLSYSGTAGNGAAKILGLKAAGGGTVGHQDTAARFFLSAGAWRDARARVRLQAAAWRHTAGRFSLRATGYRNLTSRFRAQAAAIRDLPMRLPLQAWAGRDAPSRLRLLASGSRDVAERFRLLAPGDRDVAERFRLLAPGQAARDTPLRNQLAAQGYRDQPSRSRLLAWALRDAAARTLLAARGYRHAAGRVRASSAASRDTPSRLLLQTAADTTGVLLVSPAGARGALSVILGVLRAGERTPGAGGATASKGPSLPSQAAPGWL